MKRFHQLLCLLLMLALLTACSGAPAADPEPTEEPEPEVTVEVTPEPTPESTEEPEETPELEDIDWENIYRDFLTENYEQLLLTAPGGFSGMGLMDLDLDGTAELFLFDTGASAALGLQFFDILDGEVQCISANLMELGAAFSGDWFTETYVNANFGSDFHLLEKDGDPFFMVVSGNGALDFSYQEHIVFGRAENANALTLKSVLYKYEEYDSETMEVTAARYQVNGVTATADEYAAALSAFETENVDTGYEGSAVLLWELDEPYVESLENFLALYEKTLEGYVPAVEGAN